jgi:hypothetical protein
MVDGVRVFVAVVAGDALVLVVFQRRAELGAHITVGMMVALSASLRNTMLRAPVVDSERVLPAVLAANALVLVAGHCGAELGLGVAVVVAVAGRATSRYAVLRALAVDRILVLLAPLAANTAMAVERVGGAEFGRGVAVVVAIAGGKHWGRAVGGALPVNGILVLGAEVA